MRIRTETRKVFVGGRRASFTRASAYRNEAKARVAKKYRCECHYEPDTGSRDVCERHMWPVDKWAKLVNRLARFMRYLDRVERRKR